MVTRLAWIAQRFVSTHFERRKEQNRISLNRKLDLDFEDLPAKRSTKLCNGSWNINIDISEGMFEEEQAH